MSANRGVAYIKPGTVEVRSIDYPKLRMPKSETDPFGGKDAPHGVILRVVTTNICGSDQHMVRGRTTAPAGLILGHEITGEIIEKGSDVEMLEVGDLVTVPFNIACGRCRNCREGKTGICLTVNPARPGAAYGYVDMGGWVGGQAEYVMVPYADFNLLKFPNKEKAMAKITDLTLLSDIFPTGYHGAVTAGVGPGTTVYIAGAGPVGLACAASCHLLGAAVVIVGDMIPERLAQAKSFGCEVIDLRKDATLAQQIEQILGEPVVDAAVDCVGFEAHGHGKDAAAEQPATVLNSLQEVCRAGGSIGIPGLYVTGDPGGIDAAAKIGASQHSDRSGLGEILLVPHRPVPGAALQPPAHDGDPARQGASREGGQRDHHYAGRRSARIPGLRQRRGQEVRHRSARTGAESRRIVGIADSRSVHQIAGDIHGVNRSCVLDVLEWAAIEHDQIGPLARFECPKVLRAQELRRVPGSRDDGLHRRQAGLRHEFQFPLLEVARKSAGRPGVGAEPVSDARIGQRLQILLRGFEETAIFVEVRVGCDGFLILRALERLNHRRATRRVRRTDR